ncbi:TIGR03758 family integrating conjugative element protein [Pseudomonas brenneri]|uniref:TIGR03758 family integrating conjugative element protein n=1 Tax=Pseudomonas brenneri TaxID=129817 RepID=UPI0035712771
MSMSPAQATAFQTASGFSATDSASLWLALLTLLALLWCAWVLWSGYRGWAAGAISFGAFGGAAARVLLAWLALLFFILS